MLIYRSFASEHTAYIAQSDKVIMALRNMTLSQRKKNKKKNKDDNISVQGPRFA